MDDGCRMDVVVVVDVVVDVDDDVEKIKKYSRIIERHCLFQIVDDVYDDVDDEEWKKNCKDIHVHIHEEREIISEIKIKRYTYTQYYIRTKIK